MILLCLECVCPVCGEELRLQPDDFELVPDSDGEVLCSFGCSECGRYYDREVLED
jgi:hypothetical protein